MKKKLIINVIDDMSETVSEDNASDMSAFKKADISEYECGYNDSTESSETSETELDQSMLQDNDISAVPYEVQSSVSSRVLSNITSRNEIITPSNSVNNKSANTMHVTAMSISTKEHKEQSEKKPKVMSPKQVKEKRCKRLDCIQFNTEHVDSSKKIRDFIRNQQQIKRNMTLTEPPPKPTYSDNSNINQSTIIERTIGESTKGQKNRSPNKLIHVRNKIFHMVDTDKQHECTPGSAFPCTAVSDGIGLMDLGKIKECVDTCKIKEIVTNVLKVLSINPVKIDLNRPFYISVPYNKFINFANSTQDIHLINKCFCENVLNKGCLSTVVFYKYNGRSFVVHHEKTNIVVNKTYSSFNISIFKYDHGLCQESLNTINTIVYKTNGLCIDSANGNIKIVLPSTIINKSNTYTMDCFVVWRF